MEQLLNLLTSADNYNLSNFCVISISKGLFRVYVAAYAMEGWSLLSKICLEK